jgi:hypothetical protein
MSISFIEIISSILKDGLGYKVLVWTEKENPTCTIYQMRGNFVKVIAGEIGSGGNVDLSADAIISSDSGLTQCSLILKCNVKNGLFIQLGNSLTLIVDGNLFTLNLEKHLSKTQDLNNLGEYYYIEVHRFFVNKNFIKLISNSSEVELVIRGKEQEIKGCLTKKNIKRFREFYYKYLENISNKYLYESKK